MSKRIQIVDGLGPEYRHGLPRVIWDPEHPGYYQYRVFVATPAPRAEWRRWRIEHREERRHQRETFARHARAFVRSGEAGRLGVRRGSTAFNDAVSEWAQGRFEA